MVHLSLREHFVFLMPNTPENIKTLFFKRFLSGRNCSAKAQPLGPKKHPAPVQIPRPGMKVGAKPQGMLALGID